MQGTVDDEELVRIEQSVESPLFTPPPLPLIIITLLAFSLS